jgi:PPP family 3-phenylpropionic acid transporter
MSTITPSYSLMQGAEWAIDGCLYCYSSVFLLSCGLNNTSSSPTGNCCRLSFWGQIFLVNC